MTFTKSNKSAFKAQIVRKQKAFNRLVKRFKACTNPTERRFIKNEAARICKALVKYARQWKKFGFGGNKWICNNFKMGRFTSVKTSTRRARKSYARKSYARKSRRTVSKRSRVSKSWAKRRTTRTRNTRRSRVAW